MTINASALNRFLPTGSPIPSQIASGIPDNPLLLDGTVLVKGVPLGPGGGFEFTNTFFVAKGGDDSNSGKSIEDPLLTFQAAIDATTSESDFYSIVCLDSGIYDQSLTITDRRISIFAPNANIASSSGAVLTVDDTTSVSTVVNVECNSIGQGGGVAIVTAGSGSPTTTAIDRVFVKCFQILGDISAGDISVQIVAEKEALDTTFNTPTGDAIYTAEIKTVSPSGSVTIQDPTTINGNIAGTLYGSWETNLQTLTLTVDFNDLTGGFQVLPGLLDRRYLVKDILLSNVGTNFAGGDKDLTLSDSANTVFYTTIPAATMQSLADAKWGSTEVPFPTLGGLNSPTNTGAALRLIYSGGTSDYTSGELTISIIYEIERV